MRQRRRGISLYAGDLQLIAIKRRRNLMLIVTLLRCLDRFLFRVMRTEYLSPRPLISPLYIASDNSVSYHIAA